VIFIVATLLKNKPMPELPEVQTTVDGLNKTVKGKKILGVWTDYGSKIYNSQFSIFNKKQIKNSKYFKEFKEQIIGTKIVKARRRGKNVLIDLSNHKTILVHMRMTGFFFYNPPKDERFIHLIFDLSGGKKLGFSDMRKFASVTLINTNKLGEDSELAHLGPEALGKNFQFAIFNLQINKRANAPIKQVLMDQTIIAGIGNIYSDEMLWLADIHPRSVSHRIPTPALKKLYVAMRKVLKSGIDFGGDSASDYRNIYGRKGKFQNRHKVYRKTGERCSKRNCIGKIKREIIGQRSAHFCNKHQKLFK